MIDLLCVRAYFFVRVECGLERRDRGWVGVEGVEGRVCGWGRGVGRAGIEWETFIPVQVRCLRIPDDAF